MRTSIAVAIATGLLLTACTDDGAELGFDGIATESPSPAGEPTEPTATAPAGAPADDIDVTTTPDEVTPEWVTAVVNTLLAEYGELTAEILAMPVQDDPTLLAGFEERLAELFEGEYLEFAKSELASFRSEAEARADLLSPDVFRGLAFDAESVQAHDATCIVAVGRIDRVGTRTDGDVDESLAAVALAPSGDGVATAWVVRDILANTDTQGRPNPDSAMLDATLEDYGSALDHTCGADS